MHPTSSHFLTSEKMCFSCVQPLIRQIYLVFLKLSGSCRCFTSSEENCSISFWLQKRKVRTSACVCAAKADCVRIMEGGGSSHIQWTSEQRTDGGHRAEERRLLAADCCPRCHSHMFTSHIWLQRSALTRFVGHPDPNIVSSLMRSSSV